MACESAKLFMAFMEAKGMPVQLVDDDDSTIRVGWQLDNTRMEVYLYFEEDNHDVHLLGTNFLQIGQDNYGKALQIVNICNENYRWVKFVLDMDHGQVTVEDDAIIQLDSAAEEIYELMIRMTHIVDDAYPKFMKALWA